MKITFSTYVDREFHNSVKFECGDMDEVRSFARQTANRLFDDRKDSWEVEVLVYDEHDQLISKCIISSYFDI